MLKSYSTEVWFDKKTVFAAAKLEDFKFIFCSDVFVVLQGKNMNLQMSEDHQVQRNWVYRKHLSIFLLLKLQRSVQTFSATTLTADPDSWGKS